MSRSNRPLTALALTAVLALAPGVTRAQDCASLPTSAQRPRPCNPQAECLKGIPPGLKGPARQAAERECGRQPTSGVCHGPETYNPQAECRQKSKK